MTGRRARRACIGARPRWWALLAAASGCGRFGPPEPVPATELDHEILREVMAFASVLSTRWLLYTLLLVALLVLFRRFVGLCIRVVWRLGWDSARRMARAQNALDLVMLVTVALLVSRPFFKAAPLISGVLAAGACLIAAIALPSWLQDFTAGLELSARTRLREGDQLELEQQTGTVRSIGVLRTRLRAADGATLTIPNRLLVSQPVRVGRDSGAVPIMVALPDERAEDPHYREQLERLALLCPFRRAGSGASVRRTTDGWVLTVQSWSTRDPTVAQRALEKLVRELDEPAPAEHPAHADGEGESLHA